MRGPKVRLPKQPKQKVPKPPKSNELAEIYKRTLTGNQAARVSAFLEAVAWWDKAMVSFLAVKPLTPEKMKLYERANKVRTTAFHQISGGQKGATDAEKILALERTLQLYEKVFDGHKFTSVSGYLDRFNKAKAELEAREAQLAQRFQQVLDALNGAFKPLGIEFAVQKSDIPRQFDGTSKVLLSHELAKTLAEKSRREGLLPVLFSEANTALKAASIERSTDGTAALKMEKYYSLVPQMMGFIMDYCGSVERSKVFRAKPDVLEAQPGSSVTGHVRTPRQPRPAGAGTSTRSLPRKGPLVAGKFVPGSSMALVYQALEDQQSKKIADILKTLPVGDPMGRIKAVARIGKTTGKWTVTVSSDTVQMTIH